MDHLEPKQLGFMIYLGLRMHQFQKYHLLRWEKNNWLKILANLQNDNYVCSLKNTTFLPKTILSENSCHFLIFFSQLEISDVIYLLKNLKPNVDHHILLAFI